MDALLDPGPLHLLFLTKREETSGWGAESAEQGATEAGEGARADGADREEMGFREGTVVGLPDLFPNRLLALGMGGPP